MAKFLRGRSKETMISLKPNNPDINDLSWIGVLMALTSTQELTHDGIISQYMRKKKKKKQEVKEAILLVDDQTTEPCITSNGKRCHVNDFPALYWSFT